MNELHNANKSLTVLVYYYILTTNKAGPCPGCPVHLVSGLVVFPLWVADLFIFFLERKSKRKASLFGIWLIRIESSRRRIAKIAASGVSGHGLARVSIAMYRMAVAFKLTDSWRTMKGPCTKSCKQRNRKDTPAGQLSSFGKSFRSGFLQV